MKLFPVLLLLILCSLVEQVPGQVCSPVGQLCSRTTDCCRGCCEQLTCVERTFSCSPDMVSQPGSSTCQNHYCPPNQICYLREVCPPENPCPRMPFCRPFRYTQNNTFYSPRNGSVMNTLCKIFPFSSAIIIFLLSNPTHFPSFL